jgi:cysteine-S-conjugate beta-lyase
MAIDPGGTRPVTKSIATLLTEAGRTGSPSVRVANPPVQRASTVLFETLAQAAHAQRQTVSGARHATTYGTVGTETTFALADALCEIEGAGHDVRASLAPSGLAAITTALWAFLKPGDHLLMSDSVYGPARLFAQGLLARYGVRTTFFDPLVDAATLAKAIEPATRVIYLESPGSYTFEIQDVPAICAMARQAGVMTMIDNAWASPCAAQPFDWGVDLSLVPLTKYWSGHSDVLMGAAVVRSEHWLTLFRAQRELGLCVGGDDAYLVLRGLRTAQVRMRQHEQSALAVAQWLARRPEVAQVLYPALASHPQHALWKRDFTGASGLFSFELARSATPAQLAALCEGRRHFNIGYSWGGYESLIMPAQISTLRTVRPWTGGPLVRLSIGLQQPEDLIEDLAEGFAAMQAA